VILKWVERYPIIIYIGAGVLAWTAAQMIASEPLVQAYLLENRVLEWLLYGLIVGLYGLIVSALYRKSIPFLQPFRSSLRSKCGHHHRRQ